MAVFTLVLEELSHNCCLTAGSITNRDMLHVEQNTKTNVVFSVFLVARTIMPTLIASALGIVLAAVLNFAVLDRFVFRKRENNWI